MKKRCRRCGDELSLQGKCYNCIIEKKATEQPLKTALGIVSIFVLVGLLALWMVK